MSLWSLINVTVGSADMHASFLFSPHPAVELLMTLRLLNAICFSHSNPKTAFVCVRMNCRHANSWMYACYRGGLLGQSSPRFKNSKCRWGLKCRSGLFYDGILTGDCSVSTSRRFCLCCLNTATSTRSALSPLNRALRNEALPER